MNYKLQGKDNEISTYKTKEILEENLRRKHELEIKSLKVELHNVCLANFEFEKDLSELRKENHVLKGQLQQSHEDDQNSKGQMEDNIPDLNKQVEKIQENWSGSNETTARKDRNMSKARIEDPLYEGRPRQKKFSVKEKFEDR